MACSFLLISLLLICVSPSVGLDNGQALSPPMGWRSWNAFHTDIDQQTMLEDNVRTTTYMEAIQQNRADFEGKVVVDVGAGSGILSFFAAKAGAAKVYAIEASSIAEVCRSLVAANGAPAPPAAQISFGPHPERSVDRAVGGD